MLAIVIPFFKLNFFDATLKSLVNQTDKRFKVYIGDDGSPNNCLSVLEIYKKQLNFEYVRFEENLGSKSLVKHWERCLDLINDEKWVVILGDDDVVQENYIASFYNNIIEIENLKINVIRYTSIKINHLDEKLSKIYFNPKLENTAKFLIRRLKGETRSSLSEFVFRKKCIDNVGFKDYPLAWYTDVMAILEFSEFKEIFSINTSIVKFRSSGINISSMTNNLVKKNVASYSFFYDVLKEYNIHFSQSEIEFVYLKLEKTFLDNKKNLSFWNNTIGLYLKNKQLLRLFRFIGKYIVTISKLKK